ncbi:MAG: SCO family protein [Phycisphaerales bacterium]
MNDPKQKRPASKSPLLGGFLLLLLIGAMTVTFLWPRIGPSLRGSASPAHDAADADLYASMTIPEFVARDQEGRERGRSIFEACLPTGGRYTILNFIFTRCVTVCPITTGQMIRVQQAIKDLPGYAPASEPAGGGAGKFQLVSFSVDPLRDTPESLRAHAEGFADFGVWTFLTSDQATVSAVVEKGLGFALEPEKGSKIDLGDGQSMENIIHPSKLLLIAPTDNGTGCKVIGMYRGLEEEDVDRLIARIQRMNTEPRP